MVIEGGLPPSSGEKEGRKREEEYDEKHSIGASKRYQDEEARQTLELLNLAKTPSVGDK